MNSALKPSRFVEFQAIVLAHTSNVDIHPLLDKSTPKFLLSLGNFPLLTYPLQLLEYHGFYDIIVVVTDNHVEQVTEFLTSQYSRLDEEHTRVIVRGVPEPHLGELEVLIHIHKDIKTDFLIIRSDFISNVSLRKLSFSHRTHDSSLTVLLRRNGRRERKKSKFSSNDAFSTHYIGTDRQFHRKAKSRGQFNVERLVYMKSEVDLQETKVISLSKELLDKRPCMKITRSLQVMEAAILSYWILFYILENRLGMFTLYEEFVPHLINGQFGLEDEGADLDDSMETPMIDEMEDEEKKEQPFAVGLSPTDGFQFESPNRNRNGRVDVGRLIRKSSIRFSPQYSGNSPGLAGRTLGQKSSSPRMGSNRGSPSGAQSKTKFSSAFFLSPSIQMTGSEYLMTTQRSVSILKSPSHMRSNRAPRDVGATLDTVQNPHAFAGSSYHLNPLGMRAYSNPNEAPMEVKQDSETEGDEIRVLSYCVDSILCENIKNIGSYLKVCQQLLSFSQRQLNFKEMVDISECDWEEKMYLLEDPNAYDPLFSNLFKDNCVKEVQKKFPKAFVGGECLIGKELVIGERSTCKNTIIGRFVHIGSRCKLINCVVQDHVRIENDVRLSNCVIAASAQVNQNCNLTNIVVGINVRVPAGERKRDDVYESSFNPREEPKSDDDSGDMALID